MGWTLTITRVAKARHYVKIKLVCVSDNDKMAATDLVALAKTAKINDFQGSSLMAIKADPGAATQPDQAWDFTIADDEGDALYTATDASYTAISWHDASTDIAMYPAVFNVLTIEFPTDADWTTGDTVTLYFILWVEDK